MEELLYSEKFDMPRSKIERFLLRPGAKHSMEFFSVGYTPADTLRLCRDIEAEFDAAKLTFSRRLPDGAERFTVIMWLGVTRIRPFMTVWHRNVGDTRFRFVTARRERLKDV